MTLDTNHRLGSFHSYHELSSSVLERRLDLPEWVNVRLEKIKINCHVTKKIHEMKKTNENHYKVFFIRQRFWDSVDRDFFSFTKEIVILA